MPLVEHIAYKIVVLFQRYYVMFWMDGLFVKKKKNLYLLRVCHLLQRVHSMSAGAHKSFPSQVPTALLTTALIVLYQSLQGGDPYTNRLFKNAAISLCID